MLKFIEQFIFLLISVSVLIFTSCGNDDDPNNYSNNSNNEYRGTYFNIKVATIVYFYEEGHKSKEIKICFDNYGKKIRYEQGDKIGIHDLDADIFYELDVKDKTWSSPPYSSYKIDPQDFVYNCEDDDFDLDIKKEPNRTILGKNCSACSFFNFEMENDCIAAGWNRIPFLFQSKNIHREAKSIIESVEPDAFEIPVGYTKID